MRGRPFQKGVSGNPGGRPKIPPDLAKAARALTFKALGALESIIDDSKAPAAARVSAATALLDRGWGKPTQDQSLGTPEDDPLSKFLASLGDTILRPRDDDAKVIDGTETDGDAPDAASDALPIIRRLPKDDGA